MNAHPSTDPPEDMSSSVLADSTKEYRIQNMPNWSAFVFIMVVPLLLFLVNGIASMFETRKIGAIVGIAISFGLAICIYRYLRQELLVTVAPGSIHISYLHSPIFLPTQDMTLARADVKSYMFDFFESHRLVMHMKDGRCFKVAAGKMDNTEPIEQMVKHIRIILTDKRYFQGNTNELPSRNKTAMEGIQGLAVVMLLIGIIILAVVKLISSPPEDHIVGAITTCTIIIIACSIKIYAILRLRKRLRKEDEQQRGSSS